MSSVAVRPAVERKYGVELSLLAISVLGLYLPVLLKLGRDWWEDPNYSHGFLIPFFVGYLVWRRRDELRREPLEPSNWGLAGVITGLALLWLGTLGAELFVMRFSLLPVLAGVVVFIAGWRWLRLVGFPILLLLLMIPIPAVLFNQIAFPLQLTASRLAGNCLAGIGVPVLQEGNHIVLPNNLVLEVVEACSGIRSLMALLSLGIAFAYLFESKTWIRWVLVLSTIPIAILANGLRVATAGLLSYGISHELGEGFFHAFSGWFLFLISFVCLVCLHKLMHWGLRFGRGREPVCLGCV